MATSISIFPKLKMMASPSMFNGMVVRMIQFVVMTKAVIVMTNVQNVMGSIKKKKNGYFALCVITVFMKNVSMNEDSIISIEFS